MMRRLATTLALTALLAGLLPAGAAWAAPITISVNDVTVTEGNSGSVSATFTVSLSSTPGRKTVSVDHATAAGTATSPADFTATSGTLSFSGSTASLPVSVPVKGDTIYEGTHTFTLNLSNPRGGQIADGEGVGTILDNDAAPSLAVADVSVAEGNSGTVAADLVVTLTGATELTATVNWATANGTATAGSDYVAASGTLTFPAGTTSRTASVSVNGDTAIEGNEAFFVDLSGPTASTIADGRGRATIVDDDFPMLSIDDVSAPEGNSGTSTMAFAVTMSEASGGTVTVNYATANVTATAGSDYVARSGTLTFNPGQTSKTIAVTINGDVLGEPDETFVVDLSGASGATIADAQGIGTIVDDEGPSSLVVDDVSTTEGNSGTKTLTFTVTLSPARSQTVTVDHATADATATAGSDYVANSGTLTFNPGQSAKTIAVTINGDVLGEPDETFAVDLSNASGATIADAQGVGTIVDDEGPSSLVAGDASVPEGNSGTSTMTFTVTLSPLRSQTVTVDYATLDGTAVAGEDYEAASGTLTFAPAVGTQTVEVTITGDAVYEPDETFTLELSNPTNAIVADASATGTVVDDDREPTRLTVALTKKSSKRLLFKGELTPAHEGETVSGSLFKRQRSGKWKRITTKSALLRAGVDPDGDGTVSSPYTVKLSNPGKGTYKVVVSFAGDWDHAPSQATVTFKV
jgi:hypothetical protein